MLLYQLHKILSKPRAKFKKIRKKRKKKESKVKLFQVLYTTAWAWPFCGVGEGWGGSQGPLRVGEGASKDPQLAQTGGGSAAGICHPPPCGVVSTPLLATAQEALVSWAWS